MTYKLGNNYVYTKIKRDTINIYIYLKLDVSVCMGLTGKSYLDLPTDSNNTFNGTKLIPK